MSKKENIFINIIKLLFFIYCIILIRIILFKDVPLYNIFNSKMQINSLNIVPFVETINMVFDPKISFTRIIQNVIGNIALFIPMGIFIPLIFKKKFKFTLCIGFIISLCFEVIQYIFLIGNSDIDDIVLNVLGTIIGFYIFLFIKKISKSNIKFLLTNIIMFIVFGIASFYIVLNTQSDLLKIKSTEVIEYNKEIVEDLDDYKKTTGIFMYYDNYKLSIKKPSISTNEISEGIDMTLNKDSEIILKTIQEESFLNNTIKEIINYNKISIDDFINNYLYYSERPVNIWSEDNINIDTIVIYIWQD